MKRILSLALIAIMLLSMFACGKKCEHQWTDATCLTPKTCSLCQATEGEVADHTWADATCLTPKTCTLCEVTEGDVADHVWADATCVEPKTCTACSLTEGAALGHSWTPATCVDPITCTACSLTDGEALGHTWVAATCIAPMTCSVCSATEGSTIEHKWVEATCEVPKTCSVCAATEGSAKGHSYNGIRCTSCGKADPSLKTPAQAFETLKNYIISNGRSSNAGYEYYLDSSYALVYRTSTNSILLRYEADEYGYTIFNTLFAIYSNDKVVAGAAIFASNSANYATPELTMSKASVTKNINLNFSGNLAQLASQKCTAALRNYMLPTFSSFLNSIGLSMYEMGFVNY